MNVSVDVTKVVLTTRRLILRCFEPKDLDDFFLYAKEPGVGENAGWIHHENKEETARVLSLFIKNKKTLAIVLKETNTIIGSIGIEKYNEQEFTDEINALKGREIGYVLGKAYWGQGYMPEAVKEVIRYCFNVLKLDFITCGFFKRNLQSQKVNQKCLFKYYKDIEVTTLSNVVEPTILTILHYDDFKEYMEKLQMFDENGEFLPTFMYRGEGAPSHQYYGVVDVITKNSDGKYLLTLRSKDKRTYPDCYETTGGAVQYHETFLEGAIRELYEETGIKAGKLTKIGTHVGSQTFYTQYLNEVSINPDSIVLQKGETAGYKWVTKEEFMDFFKSSECVPPQGLRIIKVFDLI